MNPGLLPLQQFSEADALTATIIVAIYMVAVLLIGLGAWRVLPSTDIESFVLANRGIGWFVGYFSTAGSQLSALTMMGFIAFYYSIGLGPYLAILVAYALFTIPLYYWLAPRVWKLGRKFGHITPSDLARDYYDSDLLGYVVAVGMILALVPYLQVQFTGVGIVIELTTGGTVPVTTGAILIGVVIAIYAVLGGMQSIAWVDAVQGVMLLVGAFLGGLLLLYTVGGGFGNAVGATLANRPEILAVPDAGPFSWLFVITFSIAAFLGWIFHPHMWIRIHYFESGRAVENLPWVALSIFWLTQVGGFTAVLAGIAINLDAPPDQFMMLMFRNEFPVVIFALFGSAVLAAMMSSASSQCHGIGAVASRDISQQLAPDASQRTHLTVARAVTVISIGLAIALAFAGIPFLLNSGAAAAALATALFFPQAVAAVRAWEWPTKQGAIAGSALGGIVGLLYGMQFAGVISGLPNIPGVFGPFWGVVANVVAFFVVSFATAEHPSDSKLRSYLDVFAQPFGALDQEHRDRLVVEDD